MEELIRWMDAKSELPDDSIDVMVCGYLAEHDDSTSCWIGFYDSEADVWRLDNGSAAYVVTHWADIPEGPKS